MKRSRRALRVSRHHAPAARVFAGTFPEHLRNLLAIRDRHDERTDPGRAGGALSMRRRQDRCERRDQFAGLYAVGEVACTGLHGANRLASNSLLEGVVIAHRAVRSAATRPTGCPSCARNHVAGMAIGQCAGRRRTGRDLSQLGRNPAPDVGLRRHRAHRTNDCSAPARVLRNLQREIREFYWNFKVTVDLLELRNLATVAALIVDSALSRKESRGLHFTLDYPRRTIRIISATRC